MTCEPNRVNPFTDSTEDFCSDELPPFPTDEPSSDTDETEAYAAYEAGRQWTKAEAEASVKRIVEETKKARGRKATYKEKAETTASLCQCELLNLYEHKGYAALGYGSMKECIEARFTQSHCYCTRLLAAARFQRKVFGPDCKLGEVKEGVLRPLCSLPEEEWADAWKEAQEEANNREYTGKAAIFHKGRVKSPITQGVARRRKVQAQMSAATPRQSVAKNVFGNSESNAGKRPDFRIQRPVTSKNSAFPKPCILDNLEPAPAEVIAVYSEPEHQTVLVWFQVPGEDKPREARIPMKDRYLQQAAGFVVAASENPNFMREFTEDARRYRTGATN